MVYVLVVLLFLLLPLHFRVRISAGISPVFFTTRLSLYGVLITKIDILEQNEKLYIVNKLTKKKLLKINTKSNNITMPFDINQVDLFLIASTSDYYISSVIQCIKEQLLNYTRLNITYMQSYTNEGTMISADIKLITCLLRIILSYIIGLFHKEEEQNV